LDGEPGKKDRSFSFSFFSLSFPVVEGLWSGPPLFLSGPPSFSHHFPAVVRKKLLRPLSPLLSLDSRCRSRPFFFSPSAADREKVFPFFPRFPGSSVCASRRTFLFSPTEPRAWRPRCEKGLSPCLFRTAISTDAFFFFFFY